MNARSPGRPPDDTNDHESDHRGDDQMAHALSFRVTIHQRVLTPAEPGSKGQPAVPAEAGTYGPQRQNVPARARRTAQDPSDG
jgi:hypothetical protein